MESTPAAAAGEHLNAAHATSSASTGTSHQLISECMRCHQECTETMQYCIQKGGEHIDPHHLKLMQTTIELTIALARLTMLHSPYHVPSKEIVAQACVACAKDCESMADDAMMDCARCCLQTAKVCRA